MTTAVSQEFQLQTLESELRLWQQKNQKDESKIQELSGSTMLRDCGIEGLEGTPTMYVGFLSGS